MYIDENNFFFSIVIFMSQLLSIKSKFWTEITIYLRYVFQKNIHADVSQLEYTCRRHQIRIYMQTSSK